MTHPKVGTVQSNCSQVTEPAEHPADSISDISPKAVLLALEEIVRSSLFRKSKQCQVLLRYVVKHSLTGEEELLRERVIGSEVFGRRPDYDASNDPIVRARVGELRKRLAQYYLGFSRKESSIRIEIPLGSYKAMFVRAAGDDSVAGPQAQSTNSAYSELCDPDDADPKFGSAANQAPREPSVGFWTFWRKVSLILATSCVIVVLAQLSIQAYRANGVEHFWGPALHSPTPILIYTGTNVVYRFSPGFLARYREAHGLSDPGPELVVDLKSLPNIDPSDLEVHATSFVTVGDISACSAITSELSRLNKPYQLRYASDISGGDVRSASVIFIGAFNNAWTLKVTEPLRFTFEHGTTIRDRFNHSRFWSVRKNPDGTVSDDYAVVSRILSNSGELVVVAAGIDEYGTEAAAEFISNPSALASLEKRLPRGWEKKNLQIVLHAKVVDKSLSGLEVVDVSS